MKIEVQINVGVVLLGIPVETGDMIVAELELQCSGKEATCTVGDNTFDITTLDTLFNATSVVEEEMNADDAETIDQPVLDTTSDDGAKPANVTLVEVKRSMSKKLAMWG